MSGNHVSQLSSANDLSNQTRAGVKVARHNHLGEEAGLIPAHATSREKELEAEVAALRAKLDKSSYTKASNKGDKRKHLSPERKAKLIANLARGREKRIQLAAAK